MENFDELNEGVRLIVDFLQQNKEGRFTTKNVDGAIKVSDVTTLFINKKPIPSIEITFDKESDFYKHRANLYRGSSSERTDQLFSLSIVNEKKGRANISGVVQILGTNIFVIVHLVEFIYAKSGRRFPYRFFEKIND